MGKNIVKFIYKFQGGSIKIGWVNAIRVAELLIFCNILDANIIARIHFRMYNFIAVSMFLVSTVSLLWRSLNCSNYFLSLH